MASQSVVIAYESDTSEFIVIDDECSTITSSSVGSTDSNFPCITSSPSSLQFCQYSNSDEEPLLECLSCASFYELGTHCPKICDLDMAH